MYISLLRQCSKVPDLATYRFVCGSVCATVSVLVCLWQCLWHCVGISLFVAVSVPVSALRYPTDGLET